MKETVTQRFLFSLFRHILTGICTILVQRGWVTAELSDEFTSTVALQIAAGVIGLGGVLWFSYKDKVWEFVKTNVAKLLPPSTSMETIVAVSKTVENKSEVAKGNTQSVTTFPGVPNA